MNGEQQPITLANKDQDTLTVEASLGLMYEEGKRAGFEAGRREGRAQGTKADYERGVQDGKRKGMNKVLRILQRQAEVELGLTYEDSLYLGEDD